MGPTRVNLVTKTHLCHYFLLRRDHSLAVLNLHPMATWLKTASAPPAPMANNEEYGKGRGADTTSA